MRKHRLSERGVGVRALRSRLRVYRVVDKRYLLYKIIREKVVVRGASTKFLFSILIIIIIVIIYYYIIVITRVRVIIVIRDGRGKKLKRSIRRGDEKNDSLSTSGRFPAKEL